MQYEIKPAGKFSLGLSELWEFRELFYFFSWRDIKIKYKQTFFGIAWAVLQPMLMMMVFTIFFGNTLNIPSDNIPYPVFVFSGLLLWNVFASGLANASNSMLVNANIIKKIYFPRLIIPMSAVLVALFDFIMALIIYFGILIYYQNPIDSIIIVFLPLSLIITVMTTFGLGTLLAALNIKYRDFRYVIPFLIQLLLFLSPVIYPVSVIKYPWLQKLLLFNPMSGAIELLRSSVTHTPLNLELIITSTMVSILIFLAGIYYFRKTEYYFADLA
ncbi:MAG: ABC transporter permease [Bacteroidia bacterium]|nr:ABC transporter permease [Bacteroidia bacterium]